MRDVMFALPLFGRRTVLARLAELASRIRAATGRTAARIIPYANHIVTQSLAVSVAYVVAGELGQATSNIRSGNIGPVWPAYGVALAGFMAFGSRIWPAVFASAFVVAFNSPVYGLAAMGQAFGATLAAAAGAYFCRRSSGSGAALGQLQPVLIFIVLGAYASATISASIGVASLYTADLVGYEGLRRSWLIYWLGDATGALLITPLLLTVASRATIGSGRRLGELLALLVLAGATSVVVFGDLPLLPVQLDVLAFAVAPFVM
jgi:integral membrane sensor domain MASE1